MWTVGHFYFVDLAFGPATGCLLAALATDRPEFLVRFLDTRPVRSLGSFSYSLYLVHAPIVVAVWTKIVAPNVRPGVPMLLTTLAIGVPLSVIAARLFASVFELPFTKHRTWPELKAAILARLSPSREPAPALTPAQRYADQLPAAVGDGALLTAQVHPVHGGPGSHPLLAGEVGGPNPQ